MIQWCSDLENCVGTGDSESILKLLKRFPSNTTDDVGSTLLHYVTESNDDNDGIVKYLFEAGFEVNVKNNQKQTALINAVIRNKVKTVKTLINFGAITDHIYYSCQIGPLHCAAEEVYIEMLKLLVDAGCRVNAKDNYNYTPLEYIIRNFREQTIEAAKILLDAGASRNHTYYDQGIGPLHRACLNQDIQMVKLLLDSRFEVSVRDDYGDTPLHWSMHKSKSPNAAADEDDNVADIVKLLIQAGADVNAKGSDGTTPLHLATEYNYKNAFDLLQEAGAELNEVDYKGNTPLHMLGQFGDKHINLAKRLVEAGADINKVNSYGRSCIFDFVGCASVDLLTYCINHGAKLDILDRNGMDLLSNAILLWRCNDYSSTLEWFSGNKSQLLDRDAKVEKKFGKYMIESQVKCSEILCKHGYDVNRVIKNGNTPFHTALESYCHTKIIRVLLRQGAIVDFNHSKIRGSMNNSCYNLKLQRIIIQHVAMNNLYKNGKGIVNFSFEKMNRQHVQDYEKCVEELKTLKNFCVYESMPLLNLIEGPVTSRYILNDHLSGLFETGIIAKSFPMFYEVLRERFEEEREKYELILKASSTLQILMKFNERSYDHIYRNILSYLGTKDHRNLAFLIDMEID